MRVTARIPNTDFKISKKTDYRGQVSFSIEDWPVVLLGPSMMEISAVTKKDISAKQVTVDIPPGSIGSRFVERLWDDEEVPAQIYTNVPNIDGSRGVPIAAPRAEVRLESIPQSATSDGEIGLKLTVKNTGKGSLYQLTGRTRSKEDFLDNHVVFLGKIDPGEQVERIITAKIPQSVKTGQYKVEMEFTEANDNKPINIPLIMAVNALSKPNLAFTYKVIDDPNAGEKIVGNGDGVIQKGEAFDLVVTVSNIGSKTAENTHLEIDLGNDQSVKLYGKNTAELGDIKPKETLNQKFNIALQHWSELELLPVSVLVREDSFKVKLKQNIELPFEKQIRRKPIPLDIVYFVKNKQAVLREGASVSAAEFGRIEKGAALHGVGELGEWIQVEIDVEKKGDIQKKRFWVERNSLTIESPGKISVASAKVTVTRFDEPPPSIVFVQPENASLETTENKMQLVISVASNSGKLTKVKFYAGGSENSLNNIRGIKVDSKSDSAGIGDSRVIRYNAHLNMGKNIFKVVAENEKGKNSKRYIIYNP